MGEALQQELLKILQSENVDEIIRLLLTNYILQNHWRTIKVLETVAEVSVVLQNQTTLEKNQIASGLLYQMRTVKSGAPERSEFPCMVPVCMNLFPRGMEDAKDAAPILKDYFTRFQEMFKDPDCFNWERDMPWAQHQGYVDYLKMVEEQFNGSAQEEDSSIRGSDEA